MQELFIWSAYGVCAASNFRNLSQRATCWNHDGVYQADFESTLVTLIEATDFEDVIQDM